MRRVYSNCLSDRRRLSWPSDYTLIPSGFSRIVRVRYRSMRKAGVGPLAARSAVVGLMMVGQSSTWHPPERRG